MTDGGPKAEKLKRGTPEYAAHMRSIARKGGHATHTRHPGHLKEIAAAGGRALAATGYQQKRKEKPKKLTLPQRVMGEKLGANTDALDLLDAIIAEVEAPVV